MEILSVKEGATDKGQPTNLNEYTVRFTNGVEMNYSIASTANPNQVAEFLISQDKLFALADKSPTKAPETLKEKVDKAMLKLRGPILTPGGQ